MGRPSQLYIVFNPWHGCVQVPGRRVGLCRRAQPLGCRACNSAGRCGCAAGAVCGGLTARPILADGPEEWCTEVRHESCSVWGIWVLVQPTVGVSQEQCSALSSMRRVKLVYMLSVTDTLQGTHHHQGLARCTCCDAGFTVGVRAACLFC